MDCFYSGMKKSLTALAFGTLGLGIAEFVMMGILPDVAKDLHISIPQAGHFISAYALGVCVGAPGMVLVARSQVLQLYAIVYPLLLSSRTQKRPSYIFTFCPFKKVISLSPKASKPVLPCLSS